MAKPGYRACLGDKRALVQIQLSRLIDRPTVTWLKAYPWLGEKHWQRELVRSDAHGSVMSLELRSMQVPIRRKDGALPYGNSEQQRMRVDSRQGVEAA